MVCSINNPLPAKLANQNNTTRRLKSNRENYEPISVFNLHKLLQILGDRFNCGQLVTKLKDSAKPDQTNSFIQQPLHLNLAVKYLIFLTAYISKVMDKEMI